MSKTFKVAIDQILIPKRKEAMQPKKVAALVESFKEIGLKTPISLRRKGDKWELVTGRHRRAAAKQIGWKDIEAREERGTDQAAEMWEVSENLHRTNMSARDEALQTTRWRELRKARAESVSAQNEPKLTKSKRGRENEGRPPTPGSVRDTASALGIDKQEVIRRAKIAKMDPKAADILEEAGIGQQVDLLAVAEEPKPQQVKVARDLIATKAAEAKAKAERALQPKPVKPNPIAKAWDNASDAQRDEFMSVKGLCKAEDF